MVEKKLDELLVKKAPFQLPEDAKKTLVAWMPWINLVFGILQLWAALAFWNLAHLASELANFAHSAQEVISLETRAQSLGMFFWVSMFVLLADGILILTAVPGLRVRAKAKGWNLLFYALILNTLYGIFRLFSEVGGGFAAFFWASIWTVTGAYFLFQVRSYYKDAKVKSKS